MKTTFFSGTPLAGLITIPLKAGKSEQSECVVKVGDKVLGHQLIGKSESDSQLNIYSSVSGRVVAIDKMLNTRNGLTQSVLIEPDENQVFAPPLPLINDRKSFLSNLATLGLMNYDLSPMSVCYNDEILDKIDSVGLLLFDEWSDIDIQYDIMRNDFENIWNSLEYILDILNIDNINIYLKKKSAHNEEIKNNILKNLKNTQKINFFELKMPKNQDFYSFFEKYLEKNNIENCFMQTPETFFDIFNGIKNGLPKTARKIYIGGSATHSRDGYVNALNGASMKQLVEMCGGLICDEQDIEDRRNDLYDDIEKMMELKKQYKAESGDKRKELKSQYLKQKKYANSLIWNFIKSERGNLMKTIRQIRVGSKKFGQIFTDFSPILDMSDNAVYFLNRKEV